VLRVMLIAINQILFLLKDCRFGEGQNKDIRAGYIIGKCPYCKEVPDYILFAEYIISKNNHLDEK
jgi:hypothetical protein